MTLDGESAEPVLSGALELHSSQIQGSVGTRRPLYKALSTFSILTPEILTTRIRLASCRHFVANNDECGAVR